MRLNLVIYLFVFFFAFTNSVEAQNSNSQSEFVEIKGVIVNFLGIPIADASVKLKSVELLYPSSKGEPPKIEKETKSDKNGVYSFTNLLEGSYEVTLARHFDISVQETKRTPIITAGKTYSLDFGMEFGSIVPCPRFIVNGTVTDQKNKGIEGAKISVINVFDHDTILTAQTNAKGGYSIGLCDPGQYIVFSNTPNYESQSVSLIFVPEETFKKVNFILRPFILKTK